MRKHSLSTATLVVVGLIMTPIAQVLALDSAQVAQCQAEMQKLQAQLAACGTNQQCLENVRRAIDEHNRRCS